MDCTEEYKEHIMYTFHGFCKVVIRNASITVWRDHSRKFKRLYEDSVAGRISDERFTKLSADYEAEQKERKEKAAALQGELSRTLEATANAENFMKVVRKYTSLRNSPLPCYGSLWRKS